jgi:hypothetical protein
MMEFRNCAPPMHDFQQIAEFGFHSLGHLDNLFNAVFPSNRQEITTTNHKRCRSERPAAP